MNCRICRRVLTEQEEKGGKTCNDCNEELGGRFTMTKQCSVCNKPVVSNDDNTCSECNKVFCEQHNTIGNQWKGKDSKDEILSTMCEECAISYISGQTDYIHDMRRDDEQETG